MKKRSKKTGILIIAAAAVIVVAVVILVVVMSGSAGRSLREQLTLGDRYLSEMDYEKALAAYRTAIEIDPGAKEAYEGFTLAYLGWAEAEGVGTPQAAARLEQAQTELEAFRSEDNTEIIEVQLSRILERMALLKAAKEKGAPTPEPTKEPEPTEEVVEATPTTAPTEAPPAPTEVVIADLTPTPVPETPAPAVTGSVKDAAEATLASLISMAQARGGWEYDTEVIRNTDSQYGIYFCFYKDAPNGAEVYVFMGIVKGELANGSIISGAYTRPIGTWDDTDYDVHTVLMSDQYCREMLSR